MTETMRVLSPHPNIYAYYDGRIAGKRLYSKDPNWLDDGGYCLGIASYSIVDGHEALVYDTHLTLEHAHKIRAHLEGIGIRKITVVLSHWHEDHVAGNAAFEDCEIIALSATKEALLSNRFAIENGTPPILPLVMPTTTFEGSLMIQVGNRTVELHHFNIHSADGCVLWLPKEQILFAGDTLEDTVTYISEPTHARTHVAELARMATWPIRWILPNHGDPDQIAAGGYTETLIHANRDYLLRLSDPNKIMAAKSFSLERFVNDDVQAKKIIYFAAYENVHDENITALSSTSLLQQ